MVQGFEPSFGATLGAADLDVAFDRGFRLGLGRAAVGDLDLRELQPELLASATQDARTALVESGVPLTPVGVELFSEWVALAAIVRLNHGEEPLHRGQIDAFIGPAVDFLNTLFCGPPR